MRKCKGKKIRLSLIHRGPNQTPYEGRRRQQRIWKMEEGEDHCNKCDALQALSKRQLRPAIDEAVESILLK